MKKGLCVLGIGVVILICNVVLLIHYGYFGDAYPNIAISRDIIYFVWISLVLSIVILGVVLRSVVRRAQMGSLSEILVVLCLVCLVGFNLHQGSRYYRIVNNKHINTEKQDYISSEYYSGISLAELKTDINADEKLIIYIGEKSPQCSVFEKNLEKTLRECRVELATYYISSDQDGKNSEEMKQLLDEYKITSVPAIIVTQKSKQMKSWMDADKHLEEIQSYIKNMY